MTEMPFLWWTSGFIDKKEDWLCFYLKIYLSCCVYYLVMLNGLFYFYSLILNNSMEICRFDKKCCIRCIFIKECNLTLKTII